MEKPLLPEEHHFHTKFPPLLFRPPASLLAFCGAVTLALVLCLTVAAEPLATDFGVSSQDLLKYVSIPVVCTVFTYVHIWAALWLTFYPLRFTGCMQIPDTNVGLGWQGIVPNKAMKMARMSTKLMTERVVHVDDIFKKIEASKIHKALEPAFREMVPKIINEVMKHEERPWWKLLTHRGRNKFKRKGVSEVEPIIAEIVADLQKDFQAVFDLEDMVVSTFTREPELLNHIFISSGYSELELIRNNGAIMGGVFGLFQVCLWIYWSAGWMLPTFGFVVGTITNWFALKVIFSPVNPVRLFGGRVVLQGYFLRRQDQVSEMYANLVTEHILSAKNLLLTALTGKKSDQLLDVIRACIARHVGHAAGAAKTFLELQGHKHYKHLKTMMADSALNTLPETLPLLEPYMDSALGLEELIASQMKRMPPAEFEQFLHPVFQEDEWKLVLMGGVLGIAVGFGQWYFLGQ